MKASEKISKLIKKCKNQERIRTLISKYSKYADNKNINISSVIYKRRLLTEAIVCFTAKIDKYYEDNITENSKKYKEIVADINCKNEIMQMMFNDDTTRFPIL